jgi:hypothetical protein
MNGPTRLLVASMFLLWLCTRNFVWEAGMGEDMMHWSMFKGCIVLGAFLTMLMSLMMPDNTHGD